MAAPASSLLRRATADEERELAERRHRRLMVPFDTDRSKEAVDVDAFGRLARDNHGSFTRRVSR